MRTGNYTTKKRSATLAVTWACVVCGVFGERLRSFRRTSTDAPETFYGCSGDFLRMLRRLSPDAPETFYGAFGDFLRSIRRKSPKNREKLGRVKLLIYNGMRNVFFSPKKRKTGACTGDGGWRNMRKRLPTLCIRNARRRAAVSENLSKFATDSGSAATPVRCRRARGCPHSQGDSGNHR